MNKKNPFPVYKVLDQKTEPTGLYQRYETRIVIDAPFESFFADKIGLQYGNIDQPIFLKFDTATQTEIDGKLYTVLILERFSEIEENND